MGTDNTLEIFANLWKQPFVSSLWTCGKNFFFSESLTGWKPLNWDDASGIKQNKSLYRANREFIVIVSFYGVVWKSGTPTAQKRFTEEKESRQLIKATVSGDMSPWCRISHLFLRTWKRTSFSQMRQARRTKWLIDSCHLSVYSPSPCNF